MQVNNWIPMTDEDWEWVNGKMLTLVPIKK